MDERALDRREFTLQSALAILSAATITISGCGDGDNSPAPGPSPGPGPSPPPSADEIGSISGNHGHTAVIDSARLMARSAFQLEIRGSANHPHLVDLTAADVGLVADGQRVSKTSSTDDGHSHTVTFN